MNIIKPRKLKKSDTIGILAVSGRIKEFEKIEKAKQFFENAGYNVIISDTCRCSHRYMAGNNDKECVDALHSFFLNDSIDAIFCARGGYGTLRLIDKIDWEIIKSHPKIFAGYSDITILLAMIYKKTGLITFHSAMPNGDFSNKVEEYTKTSFFNALTGKTSEIKPDNKLVYNKGIAKGILWGGNLSSLVSLCGIDFVPDEDLILFIEDLNEPVYKIDKMLTQLFNQEQIRRNVKGIILGEFKDIENESWFEELLKEFAQTVDIPLFGKFRITHDKIKDTIPFGVNVVMDTENGIVKIKENYVI